MWVAAGRSAGGTRCFLRPLGDGSLARESPANAELDFAVQLCATLAQAGEHVSIENPDGGYVFLTPSSRRCVQLAKCTLLRLTSVSTS